MNQVLFHLAFPVNDIAQTKKFYADGLGCEIGRESPNSVILNLYGNQIVAHVAKDTLEPQKGIYPRHFGLVFTLESDWEALLERAEKNNLKFYQQPKRRFTNSPLEHRTFFLEDPFHNLLEFKYYCHSEAIFGCNEHQKVGDVVEV
ncbi:VOC family protein [Okeania sp. KiyG1]|uniref:VOC family protein n=1 Tax=Okeania sp. KiyG1 TaxID=2720165 RepID=UPI001921D3EB|nr:VOC family protein [Okeania sp. KiyG1]GGA19553.1 glyoxalase [Okeania sp. KiyG1]